MSIASESNTKSLDQILTKPKFWTVAELAAYLRVPKTWIYDRTRIDGPDIIPHVKLGKYVRFDPDSEAFQRWLMEQRIEIPPESIA